MAKAVQQARATERTAAEQADAETTLAQRTTGRRCGDRLPTPPVPEPRDGDRYNVPDPESCIMKHPTDAGCEQNDNAQVAVDQGSLLIVDGLSHSPQRQSSS